MPSSSRRSWKTGVLLALGTTMLWGMLPIGLKALIRYMDPYTITWYRFLSASILLFVILALRQHFFSIFRITGKHAGLLALAAFGLCGNYILYLLGLDRTDPGTAQMVIQISPICLLLGGVLLFKEKFSRRQWSGFGFVLSGLALFFHQRLTEIFTSLSSFTSGILFIIAAALVWAIFGLVQKQLSQFYGSQHIMLVIYTSGAFVFFPFATPNQVENLDGTGIILLTFCCLNTLLAYGGFAEALARMEASRVSAIIALTPLITLGFMSLTTAFYPDLIAFEPLTALSIIGSFTLVTGSIIIVSQ
ncbi:MAG: DMT family transporter [SAR324 cluster bacterium]|nr:DMT family transporter [SAR324 cluster bacterium]